MRRTNLIAMLLTLALGADAAIASPKPTPVPGGANQTAGVNGTMSQVLFNGTLRLRKMSLTDAAPGDTVRPGPGQRALVFHAIISNGTHRYNHGYFDASLADADGITVAGRPLDDGWDLQPAAAAHTTYGFAIPSGFVPTRLVLIQVATQHARAFRIAIRPSDLPAPGAAQ